MTQRTETIEFTTIDKGTHTQYREAGIWEITRIEEWRHLWQKLKANDDVPFVEFGQYQVVVVLAGVKRTDGYSLEITSVGKDEEAGLSIQLEYRTPGKRIVPQIETNPYHIIQIPQM